MTTHNPSIQKRLIELAEPVCADRACELVDIEYRYEGHGWVVRVFIDRAASANAGQGIGFADCEALSRELSALFDVEDPVPQAYNLEVSSPGVERPLRLPEHYRRFAGAQAKISLSSPLNHRKNFQGTLVGYRSETIEEGGENKRAGFVQIQVAGILFELPHTQVRSARLVPDWEALFAHAQPKEPAPQAPHSPPHPRSNEKIASILEQANHSTSPALESP